MSQTELWSRIDDSLIRIRDAFADSEAARQGDRKIISQILTTQSNVLVTQGKMLTQLRFQWVVLAGMVVWLGGLLTWMLTQ